MISLRFVANLDINFNLFFRAGSSEEADLSVRHIQTLITPRNDAWGEVEALSAIEDSSTGKTLIVIATDNHVQLLEAPSPLGT